MWLPKSKAPRVNKPTASPTNAKTPTRYQFTRLSKPAACCAESLTMAQMEETTMSAINTDRKNNWRMPNAMKKAQIIGPSSAKALVDTRPMPCVFNTNVTVEIIVKIKHTSSGTPNGGISE